jgi:hypothetical protein
MIMAKKKRKSRKLECMICGRKIARKIELPNGELNLCTDLDCLNKLNYLVNDQSIPIVWFSMNDFINHDESMEEIVKPLVGDFFIAKRLSQEVNDYIWGGETLGQIYHDALDESRASLEEFYVKRLEDRDLLLANVNTLETDAGKLALERRLKGESNGC